MAAAMTGGLVGAWLATQIPSQQFRVALPFVLAAVWIYTLWRKDMGHEHAPHWSARQEAVLATLLGGTVGFYDGVFGPGTGSFFVFALVRGLGWDFLHASAAAKRLKLCDQPGLTGLVHPKWSRGVGLVPAHGGRKRRR